MGKEQIERIVSLLAQAEGGIAGGNAAAAGAAYGQQLNTWKSAEEEVEFAEKEEAFLGQVKRAAAMIGEIVADEEINDEVELLVSTRAGWFNANSAFLYLKLGASSGKLQLTAYAKEGLINQQTAPKAIKRFLAKL